MQRLNKNLAISAFDKIRNSLKTGVIRQMDTFFELMSEDGLVNLGQIRDELYPQSEKGSANASFNRFIKQINEELAAQGSRARLAITADKKAGDKRDCWFEAEPVQPPIPHTPQLDAIPEDQLEQAQLGLPMLDVDIVLITFNQHELEQTLRCFCPNAPAVQMEGHNRFYYQLGKHGGQNLVLMHSRQATIEAMKSAEIAIEFFQPNAVIALGIAFGINSEKQQIGEVLISESITTYELARINKDGRITPRGPRPPASKHLRDWFHQLDANLTKEKSAEYAKRYFGSMFSGDKLIDNKDYRDQLLSIDPEAIGGEMEGTGIYNACEASKTDWIIVKAICDFADGNKGKNKDANQKIAAENAARLVKAALEFGNLYPSKKVSSSEKLRTKHSLKNFHDYTANCTNLHEIDERALVKDARALPTTLKKEQAALLEQEHTNGIPVVARLLDWAQEPQVKSVFAILGEYGMGKTISCQLFDKQLRSLLTQNKLLPVPLYFDLRHVTSKTLADGFQFSDIIKDCIRFGWLKSDSSEEFTFSDIERWANQSGVVLIFDGLDEVLVKLSESDGRIFTDQLYKYQAQLKANSKQPVKMLLTCRSQYFKTLDRQKDHFTGQERGGVSAEDIEAMVMLPLTEEQITNYLRHALPGIEPATIIDMVKSVHDLHDLSKRPFTLKLVGEFFPALEEDRKAGKAISGVNLYRRVVDRWLNRDDGKHQIKSDHKLQLASHLAALLWKQKQSALPASEIEDWFMGWLADNPRIAFRYQGISPDILEEDLRTATFLCREDTEQGSRFRFSHTSLQEYFLANYLLQAISDNKPEHWAITKPSNETLVFLAQLLAEPEHKYLVNKLSEWRNLYRQYTSENLLCYALTAFELGFSVPVLHGIQLNGAKFSQLSIKMSLEKANFNGSILRQVNFTNTNLAGVDFRNANIVNTEFDKCKLNESKWNKSNVIGTRFFCCELDKADLNLKNSNRSYILNCYLNNKENLIISKTNYKKKSDIRYFPINHTAEIMFCEFSPDGRYVISGSCDKSIRLWDVLSGNSVQIFLDHKESITSCAFSNKGDFIISGSDDGNLRFWDVSTGKCIRELDGHGNGFVSFSLSPNDSYLVSGSYDSSLQLWDILSGECLREFSGHTDIISCSAFSSKGDYFISGSHDNTLRLWNVLTGECVQEFRGHMDVVNSCAISSDNRYVASASRDMSLRLWDMSNGKCLIKFKDSTGDILSCRFSADGSYLISTSSDNRLRLWEVTSGECLQIFSEQGFIASGCALSADGKYVASRSDDNSWCLWDISNGNLLQKLYGLVFYITCCTYSPNGKYFISDSGDNNLHLRDTKSGEYVRKFSGHTNWITSCTFSSDGKYLVSCSFDGDLRLWDVDNGKCLRIFSLHSCSFIGLSCCDISPDGQYLIAGDFEGGLYLWSALNGEYIREFKGHSSWISSCIFSMDGNFIASGSGSGDENLCLWELATGNRVQVLKGHTSTVSSCAFTSDDQYLISASYDNSMRLWNVKSGDCLRQYVGHTDRISSCALSKDDQYLISGSDDNSVRLWDVTSGECLNVYNGHANCVSSVDFSPDGKSFISSAYDCSVRLWSISDPNPQITIFLAPDANYVVVDEGNNKLLSHSEYAWRYFNGYFINEKGEPDSFPVI